MYLSSLLSAAPLKIIKPPSSTPFRKLNPKSETPNKVQLLSCYPGPGPKSMAEWTLKGRSLGGKGYVQAPPPPMQGSVSLPGICYIPSFSWFIKPRVCVGQIPGSIPSLAQGREVIHCEDWPFRLLLGFLRRNRP